MKQRIRVLFYCFGFLIFSCNAIAGWSDKEYKDQARVRLNSFSTFEREISTAVKLEDKAGFRESVISPIDSAIDDFKKNSQDDLRYWICWDALYQLGNYGDTWFETKPTKTTLKYREIFLREAKREHQECRAALQAR